MNLGWLTSRHVTNKVWIVLKEVLVETSTFNEYMNKNFGTVMMPQ